MRLRTDTACLSPPNPLQGDPEAPMCGFSNMVCKILTAYGAAAPASCAPAVTWRRLSPFCACEGVDFQSRDVLADPDIREGVKKYSQWPTIPQVPVQAALLCCKPLSSR